MKQYLENDYGCVGVIPSLGGKVFSLFDIKSNTELLWSPNDVQYKHYNGTDFDNQWTGGFDDMFPNDIPCVHNGMSYQDHGFLWNMNFDCIKNDNSMHLSGMNDYCQFTKYLTLDYNKEQMQNTLKAVYTLVYTADCPLEYIFKLHPAFVIDESTTLTIPGGVVYCDDDYNSHDCPNKQYMWPLMTVADGNVIDVSKASSFKKDDSIFHYVTLTDGFFSINSLHGFLHMRFDRAFFPNITIYQTDGFTIIEPCTGIPAHIGVASSKNQTRIIRKGEMINTSFTMSFSGAK